MTENARCRRWMKRNELTQKRLAELTGYTSISLYWFLRGETPPQRNAKSGNADDRAIKPWVWLRFKRACGDVDAEIHGRKAGEQFNW